MKVVIRRFCISPGHNFFGHRDGRPGPHPLLEPMTVQCRAGWGIEGDRFYGYRPGYKGQVTFFAWETYEAIKTQFSVPALSPGAFRRNILIEGVDLNALIGRRFVVDAVEFEGTGEASPCAWMNQAVAPGAEEWLRRRGGLRARVIGDGALAVGAAELLLLEKSAQPKPAARFVGKRAVELGLEGSV